MANELSINLNSTSIINGGQEGGSWQATFTQAGTVNLVTEQAMSVTVAVIDLGTVTPPCRVAIRNLDPTNSVKIGMNASETTNAIAAPVSTLLAATTTANRDACLLHLAAGQIVNGLAAAGTPKIQVHAFSD
jgi:hypothetical protein